MRRLFCCLHKACVVDYYSIVVKILNCMCKALCSGLMFCNLQVVRPLHCLCNFFVVYCCSFSSWDLSLSVQGSKQWSAFLEHDCSEAFAISVRGLYSESLLC